MSVYHFAPWVTFSTATSVEGTKAGSSFSYLHGEWPALPRKWVKRVPECPPKRNLCPFVAGMEPVEMWTCDVNLHPVIRKPGLGQACQPICQNMSLLVNIFPPSGLLGRAHTGRLLTLASLMRQCLCMGICGNMLSAQSLFCTLKILTFQYVSSLPSPVAEDPGMVGSLFFLSWLDIRSYRPRQLQLPSRYTPSGRILGRGSGFLEQYSLSCVEAARPRYSL